MTDKPAVSETVALQATATHPLEIALGTIAETLLIPLSARALAPQLNPDLLFRDQTAEALLDRLGVDPGRFSGDRASMRGSIIRARWFDIVTKRFLAGHPDGLVVSLGSGLDTRAERNEYSSIDGGRWIDTDQPEVIALRQSLISARPGVINLAADLEGLTWLGRLPWSATQDALFIAEGVLMYLQPDRAHALLRAIGQEADARNAHVEIAFDYASPWMVRNSRRHPSLRKTKARFHWALRRPEDVRAIDPRLRVVEHFDVTAETGALSAMMGKLHRLLTGREIYACVRFAR